jgi:hypothetical protein
MGNVRWSLSGHTGTEKQIKGGFTMSYELTCSLEKDHVRIRMDGAWPDKKPEEVIAAIHALWEKHHKRHLLIDIRNMSNTPSVTSDYYEAKHFVKTGFIFVGRIGVLDNLDRKEANDFFETTAANRGLRFRFFYTDEQEAIDWLDEGRQA